MAFELVMLANISISSDDMVVTMIIIQSHSQDNLLYFANNQEVNEYEKNIG